MDQVQLFVFTVQGDWKEKECSSRHGVGQDSNKMLINKRSGTGRHYAVILNILDKVWTHHKWQDSTTTNTSVTPTHHNVTFLEQHGVTAFNRCISINASHLKNIVLGPGAPGIDGSYKCNNYAHPLSNIFMQHALRTGRNSAKSS